MLALALTSGATAALAEDPPAMSDHEDIGMMDCGAGSGEMRSGHPRGRGVAMRFIFALMDSDGDGTVSLQEYQAAHEKIFKAMDTDKDGTLTLEEIRVFMRGSHKAKEHEERE